MKQAHVFISGFVQGVGFRAFIRNHARRLGINGWVKNLTDGRIEAVLQPSVDSHESDVEDLINLCNHGPFMAEVDEVTVDWENAEEIFDEFKIAH